MWRSSVYKHILEEKKLKKPEILWFCVTGAETAPRDGILLHVCLVMTLRDAVDERPAEGTSEKTYTKLCKYLVGVSVRRVEDITEVLWGTQVSSGTINNLYGKRKLPAYV